MNTERTGKTYARKFLPPAIGAIIAGLVVIALVAFAWETWEDLDNDGMDDAFEHFFGLDTGTDDHAGDPDGDLLTNIEESLRGTDPFRADTDLDGWPDNVDSNPVSRAVFPWGEPRFTREDVLIHVWPEWVRAAWAHGGAWLPGEPWGWMSDTPGDRLLMHVDRTLASNDLWLAVAVPGGQASLLTAGGDYIS